MPLGLTEWLGGGIQPDLGGLATAFVYGCVMNGVAYITWALAVRSAAEQGVNLSRVVSLSYSLPVLSLATLTLLFGEAQLGRAYFIASVVLMMGSFVLAQLSDQIAGAVHHRL
jgi:hypothetical protein